MELFLQNFLFFRQPYFPAFVYVAESMRRFLGPVYKNSRGQWAEESFAIFPETSRARWTVSNFSPIHKNRLSGPIPTSELVTFFPLHPPPRCALVYGWSSAHQNNYRTLPANFNSPMADFGGSFVLWLKEFFCGYRYLFVSFLWPSSILLDFCLPWLGLRGNPWERSCLRSAWFH